MKPQDLLHETYVALSANKARSGLTILGIVIGISSVIAMVSIGAGAQNSIQSQIQSLGANLVQVLPGAQRNIGFGASAGRGSAQTLTLEDAEAVSTSIAHVEGVSPEVSGRYQVTAKGTNTNTSVLGITSSYPAIRNVAVSEGMFVSDTHNLAGSKVAVLGPTVQADLFGEGNSALGQTIRINKVEFKVIGITETKGGSGFTNQDDTIFIPLATAQRYLSGSRFISSISIQATDASSLAGVAEETTQLLLARHKISDPTKADFSILNQADILGAASSITQTFTLLLAAVAGISLVVGGIGIMNMMLTNVTERTREIGLRKAIGATKEDISRQFLLEAVILTLAGGFIGVLLGVTASYGIKILGILETSVSLSSIALAFGVSAAIGVTFGWYPARRAAALNPIHALRYE